MTKYPHLSSEYAINYIASLYEQGLSENAIAKMLSVSRIAIRPRLIKAGVHIRTQSEAEALKWKQMSTEQRKRQIEAYHAKIRGGTRTHEDLVKRAKGVEAKQKLSKLERFFLKIYQDAGYDIKPLYAIDIFNIDLAIPSRKLAIEIDGGNWHTSPRKRAQDKKKEDYLLANGWKILHIKGSQKGFLDQINVRRVLGD